MITFAVLISFSHSALAQSQRERTDDSQAQEMLHFLQAVAEGKNARPRVDTLMAMKGTRLIIEQQNVSRRVSDGQYREVLLALAENRNAQLNVPNGDARAAKGKEGLLRDVLPSLRWGSGHVDLLASRLSRIAKLDIRAEAQKLALDNLPEPVPLEVPLFVVMGGRAGAAANESGIYFDVLASSHRDPDGYPQAPKIVEFFAHEMHHVGLGRMLDVRENQLHLDEEGRRAFALLCDLVMEGSASYLINGHRDLESMRKDPMFATPGDDQSRLKAVEQILAGVLEHGWNREQYDQAMSQLEGNAFHMTGAKMLDAIWRTGGRKAVMVVLRDPRQFLNLYNNSIQSYPHEFRFSSRIAHRVALLGGTYKGRLLSPTEIQMTWTGAYEVTTVAGQVDRPLEPPSK